MKNKILSILFLVYTITSFSQDIKSLKSEAQLMYDTAISLDLDKILDQTYPKVFEIASREQMKDVMFEAFNNEAMTIKLIKTNPNFSFGEIKKIGNQTFCIFEHDNKMTMTFKEDMSDSAELMLEMIKESMGATEATYDTKTFTFTINKRSKVLAISDDLTKNTWKYVNIEKEGSLIQMLFSEDIVKKLGL